MDTTSSSSSSSSSSSTAALALLCVLFCNIFCSETVQADSFDHSTWDRLLHKYVDKQGRVAYRALHDEEQTAFDEYLKDLAAARPLDWPREEQLAFWINAYNAVTVAAVLKGNSAESLLGRGKLFKLWKLEVAGKKRTPDSIEHKVLRQQFHEPRIHFAIVCASTSCPKLRSEAFAAALLDSQLTDQAKRFINDPSRNQVSMKERTLRLSKIFKWFKKDFRAAGGVCAFLAHHVQDAATRRWLSSAESIKIKYLDYDWSLNSQPNQRPGT